MGVFLLSFLQLDSTASLPHARGGVSAASAADVTPTTSSPRPWGCFLYKEATPVPKKVFPTPVGVFPSFQAFSDASTRLPHARGGVSLDGAIKVGLV
ncbi:hypothetical protein BMETH_297_3 [methanotrophic bacterial endosymbiont of Bathymodiolus sp.]|nr:hypothetical protein BMETH_297_3 [methanotrophic bacterial endosymbiont of Bathymodiolus sp.]